jgi:hypothetical protein
MPDASEPAQRYEAVPASLVCPAVPQLVAPRRSNGQASSEAGQPWTQGLEERGWKTLTASLAAADARTQALIEECKRRIGVQEPWALVQLLDQYPILVQHEWVRTAIAELIRAGLFKRRRGRPHARYKIHPLVIIGMVQALIRVGEVVSPEKAFFALEGYGVLSYDEAKRGYYAGLREDRFQPIFMTFESYKQDITAQGYEQAIAAARKLKPGRPLRYPIQDPVRGEGELVFEATSN